MKKVLLLLGIVLSFALVSCADEPFQTNAGSTGTGNFGVTIDQLGGKDGAAQVTNVTITIVNPSNVSQTQTWTPSLGLPYSLKFTASTTGTYTLKNYQCDNSGNAGTTSTSTFTLQAGYNYYVTVTVGGSIGVILGGPGGASSVYSSVASSVSSVASSVSSVASSASSHSSVSSVASSSSSVASTGTTFGLYTETYPVNVVWDTDAVMDVWNAGFALADDTTVAEDGLHSLKLTCLASSSPASPWGGLGLRVNPITSGKDLSAFVGGSLVFWYRSTKTITKVGVQDLAGNQAWISGATCVSTYGMRTDGTWSKVTIPQSALAYNATGTTPINWSSINQYFMLVTDGANHVVGNVYNIDNIYFTK